MHTQFGINKDFFGSVPDTTPISLKESREAHQRKLNAEIQATNQWRIRHNYLKNEFLRKGK